MCPTNQNTQIYAYSFIILYELRNAFDCGAILMPIHIASEHQLQLHVPRAVDQRSWSYGSGLAPVSNCIVRRVQQAVSYVNTRETSAEEVSYWTLAPACPAF